MRNHHWLLHNDLDLRKAPGRDLRDGDLSGANLHGVNLGKADLRVADLSGANLERTNVTPEQLEQAAVVVGAEER